MKVTALDVPGVLLIEPKTFGDARGFFFESWHRERYADAGIREEFVQDNISRSGHGTLRGLHVQHPQSQGKLVSVLAGEVYDVSVDIRRGSPTFGNWVGVRLSESNHRQVYLPPGFAHGFQVLSESALFLYKCTEYYRPENEATIAWDDADLAIDWPIENPTLSAKDIRGHRLREIPADRQPSYP